MIEFQNYFAQNQAGRKVKITIASGPVIIERGQVLLVKHGPNRYWKFPGGRLRDDNSLAQNCAREAKEELGIKIKIIGRPFVIMVERKEKGTKNYVLLIHYRAKRLGKKIVPGADIKKWAWCDIKNLPQDCAENIKLAVKYFSR